MNEEEKLKKRVVKEDGVKLPDPNPEKKANKIIKKQDCRHPDLKNRFAAVRFLCIVLYTYYKNFFK